MTAPESVLLQLGQHNAMQHPGRTTSPAVERKPLCMRSQLRSADLVSFGAVDQDTTE